MNLNALHSDWHHKIFIKVCLEYKKNPEFLSNVKKCSEFIKNHNDFFINLAYSKPINIKNVIKKFIDIHSLPNFFSNYLCLIIFRDQANLLAEALDDVVEKILNSDGIYTCYVFSSHKLSKENELSLISKLEEKIKTKINPIFILDPKLIFGIKVIYNGKAMLYLENSIVNIIRIAKQKYHSR